jgi:hypothetical protein
MDDKESKKIIDKFMDDFLNSIKTKNKKKSQSILKKIKKYMGGEFTAIDFLYMINFNNMLVLFEKLITLNDKEWVNLRKHKWISTICDLILFMGFRSRGQIDECSEIVESDLDGSVFDERFDEVISELAYVRDKPEEFIKKIKKTKMNATTCNLLGASYYKLGKHKLAKKYWDKGLQLLEKERKTVPLLSKSIKFTKKLDGQLMSATNSNQISDEIARNEQKFSADLYISQLEIGLRNIIKRKLGKGSKWEKKFFPNDVLKSAMERKHATETSNMFKKENYEIIDFLDFRDYEKIILKKDNWKQYFENVFEHYDDLRTDLKRLAQLRNAIKHNRGKSVEKILSEINKKRLEVIYHDIMTTIVDDELK